MEIPLQKPSANQRRVKLAGPVANNSNLTKYIVADSMNQTNSPAPPPSPSGDSYNCNRLSGDYVYTVPVGNGNYINIQGNDPELTKVCCSFWKAPISSVFISHLLISNYSSKILFIL